MRIFLPQRKRLSSSAPAQPVQLQLKTAFTGLRYHFKMADLLGSILNSMEKPPTVGDQESRRKARGTDCIA